MEIKLPYLQLLATNNLYIIMGIQGSFVFSNSLGTAQPQAEELRSSDHVQEGGLDFGVLSGFTLMEAAYGGKGPEREYPGPRPSLEHREEKR